MKSATSSRYARNVIEKKARLTESWRLKNGDTLAVWEIGDDGKQIGTGRTAIVNVGNRTVLFISLDDGTEIKLVR